MRGCCNIAQVAPNYRLGILGWLALEELSRVDPRGVTTDLCPDIEVGHAVRAGTSTVWTADEWKLRPLGSASRSALGQETQLTRSLTHRPA